MAEFIANLCYLLFFFAGICSGTISMFLIAK